jgi:hypothetical protein
MSSLQHTYIEYDMGDFIIVVKRNCRTMKSSNRFLQTLKALSFTALYNNYKLYWYEDHI